ELAHWGADADLVTRSRSAARDEIRHARMLGSLARREGATLSEAPVVHGPIRSLFEIALENAVEGCVRETFGALVAGWQADHAKRQDVRRVMMRIYRDEVTHADLAWQVHAWISKKLSPKQLEVIEGAMDRAIGELVFASRKRVPNAL